MPRPLSARTPAPSHSYDVIVIGGGVNGVAIARELAFCGKRVLVLERNDFASGTSSRSTRIIHGGLRYLEHGELSLVRESLREREWLLRTKPHLVRPMRFVLATAGHSNFFSLRNPFALRAGVSFYRAISGIEKGAKSAKDDLALLERSLDAGQRWTLLDYEDAQCEFPERLIADWLVEAARAGAVALNHTEVLGVSVETGRATGVRTRDYFTGEEASFSATSIINATGPWADQVTENSGIPAGRMVGGVRGSHITLPRFSSAPDSAIYAEAVDGRPIFIIPWNGQTLVGTTEVADTGEPARTRPSPQEMAYLMRSFLRLFPNTRFTTADVISCFAGIRPLPYSKNRNASGITRRHFLHDHSDDGARGLISVIGGKLTTATSLARECCAKIGIQPSVNTPCLIAPESSTDKQHNLEVLSEVTHSAIHQWHGANADPIFRSAFEKPAWAVPLCPHSPHILAEALYAVQHEHAFTLGDVLLRRVPVALSACWSGECSLTASERIGQALGWSGTQISAAYEEFESERIAFLMKPDQIMRTAAD